jgi:hypothetical protein
VSAVPRYGHARRELQLHSRRDRLEEFFAPHVLIGNRTGLAMADRDDGEHVALAPLLRLLSSRIELSAVDVSSKVRDLLPAFFLCEIVQLGEVVDVRDAGLLHKRRASANAGVAPTNGRVNRGGKREPGMAFTHAVLVPWRAYLGREERDCRTLS